MTQNKLSLKFAVTGGIGSGKSTVINLIAQEGYKVFSCDEIYRQLLTEKYFLSELSSAFGDVLNSDGTLNRKRLSEIVFTNKAELEKLNKLTHTLIVKKAIELMGNERISFCEVPLLFEGGFEELFDGVLVVLRNREERIKATVERDKLSEDDVILRLKSQIDYDNFDFEKYYVIHNDSGFTNLASEVKEFLAKIK